MSDEFICSITKQKLSNKNLKFAVLPDGERIPIHKDYIDVFQNAYLIAKNSIDRAKSAESVDISDQPEDIQSLNLKSPKEIFNQLCERVVGQEIAKKKVAVAIHRHYISISSDDPNKEWKKSNLLFIGDSGSGKTHIARAVSEMIQVPFVVGDCTQITEAGYVGDDAEAILSILLSVSKNVKDAERSIVFLDEVDKIAKKSGGNPSITRDVGGEGVQTALLKIIEGTIVHVQNVSDGKRKNPQAKTTPMNTEDILFIGAGVFPGIEDIIAKRLNLGGRIGFRGESKHNQDEIRKDLLPQISAQDLIDYGFISEFVGRFPVIIPFEKLTKEHLKDILVSIKGSIYEQSKWIFSQNQIDLQISDEGLSMISDAAFQDPRGARALQSIIEAVLMEVYFDNVGISDGVIDIPNEMISEKIAI